MRFKLRQVLGLLAALVVLWAGNLGYFYANQLKKPLFLNHYYDLTVYNNSFPNIEIFYLVNRGKPMDLVSFEIPGHSEILLRVMNNQTLETFSHQVLKKAQLNLSADPKIVQPGTEIAFQEANVYFSNNTKVLAPIGQIYLTMVNAPKDSPLHWSSGGSSNANSGYTNLQANQELKVTGFRYHFQEQLRDNLHVTLNDSEVKWPLALKQGDSFNVSYRFSFPDKDNPLAAGYYRIDGKLVIETPDGVKSTVRMDMHYAPYFREKNVQNLKLEREKTMRPNL